jgi:type IV pilus assembly protein PilN
MSRSGWLASDWDLLKQRRLERGLPAAGPPLTPARPLLLQGSALGGGLLLAVLLGWGWVGLRQGQVARQLEGLRGIPVQLQRMEAQALQRRRQVSSVQRSNEALAKALVAVSSGSALLAQLAAITPQGVQLTDAAVQGSTLSLKGLAVDPQAFRRVNALSLLLGGSPLVQPASVRVVKLSREQSSGAAAAKPAAGAGPVAWELSAGFATLPAARQLAVLQQLGAEGMARRLQILERAGVLR